MKIEPITGRDAHIELEGREHRVYFEEAWSTLLVGGLLVAPLVAVCVCCRAIDRTRSCSGGSPRAPNMRV